jgi:hypothetical protein
MSCHLRVLMVVFTGVLVSVPGAAWASSWVIPLNVGSRGDAQGHTLPPAPSGVAAACSSSSGKTIKVTWNSVTHASSYSIYQSTVSGASGFSLAASGVTGTSWTSGTLSNATYWFEVAAKIGTNWAGPNSTATASHAVISSGCT